MQLTLSDLLELAGVAILLVAAALWDVRAFLAVLGLILMLVGYMTDREVSE